MSITLRQRMHQDLQLAGLAEGTQKAYLRAVRQLAAHFHKPPDQITEHEVREYLRLPQGTSESILPAR